MGNAIFEYEEQPDEILKTMKHLYFDLAGKVLPQQLPMLLEMADENRIVYGSDTPYTIEPVVKKMSRRNFSNKPYYGCVKRNMHV